MSNRPYLHEELAMAHAQGYAAAWPSVVSGGNPYGFGSEVATAWTAGWCIGQRALLGGTPHKGTPDSGKAATSSIAREKQFFFEKKNQKTFDFSMKQRAPG